MLDDLDSTDWHLLRHAHGSAADVPALLRALLSADDDQRKEACIDLHERVWHQGTIYPASAAVLPFLRQLLSSEDVFVRDCAVSLICCIATGTGWITHGIRMLGEAAIRDRLEKKGCTLEQSRQQEVQVLQAIQAEVAQCLPDLVPHLGNTEDLAGLVAEVLIKSSNKAEWAIRAIDEAVNVSANPEHRSWLADTKRKMLEQNDEA
ncbi:MAG: hypothetical protein U0930_07615 [Pirellulales bacterium]